MVFTTQIFLFWFLPLVIGLYYIVPRPLKAGILTLVSFLFYGWWRPDFVGLMAFSAVVDYTVGRLLERTDDAGRRKRLLILSCVTNLGLLGYFKYANFGVETMNALLASMDIETVRWTAVILPVGISFYTFQSMSYTIDVYRREVPVVKNPINFMCYVSLFPQLVAGPIVRYREVADQLDQRTHSVCKLSTGVLFFMAGFCKKILIADSLAPLADGAFSSASLSFVDAWVGTLAYTFQIYFDFSGYSDMAIGLGMMFGFRFPVSGVSRRLSPRRSEGVPPGV